MAKNVFKHQPLSAILETHAEGNAAAHQWITILSVASCVQWLVART